MDILLPINRNAKWKQRQNVYINNSFCDLGLSEKDDWLSWICESYCKLSLFY